MPAIITWGEKGRDLSERRDDRWTWGSREPKGAALPGLRSDEGATEEEEEEEEEEEAAAAAEAAAAEEEAEED
jgi:hypothetical protein